jgi:hypothetical protein
MKAASSPAVSIPSASSQASIRPANSPTISVSAARTGSVSIPVTSARSSLTSCGRTVAICCSPE